MKPIEPLELVSDSERDRRSRFASVEGGYYDASDQAHENLALIAVKINALAQAHNELLAKYESHTHQYGTSAYPYVRTDSTQPPKL